MSERNIVVYYFTDSTRRFVLSGTTRWYKYARSANQKAYDAMVMNLYGANVAVVYDDDTAKDLYVIVRHADNRVETVWDHEAEKKKYSGTSVDPFGEFVRKRARSRKNPKTKPFDHIFGKRKH